MSKVVSLDEYREALTVRSITHRLMQRYDPTAVRKTIAGLLMQKGSSVSMIELCATAKRMLECPEEPVKRAKPRRRLRSGSEPAPPSLRLIVWNEA